MPSLQEIEAEIAYRRAPSPSMTRLCIGYARGRIRKLIAARSRPEPEDAESVERTPSVWRATLTPGA